MRVGGGVLLVPALVADVVAPKRQFRLPFGELLMLISLALCARHGRCFEAIRELPERK